VKRLTWQSLCAVVAISLAGAAVAVVIWGVATTSGARWLLTSVIPLLKVSFSAQKIEGRIIDHLLLTEVRVGLPQQRLEIDRFELRWKPLLLLAGTVAVQEMLINGVRVQDDAPSDNKPPVLAWPSLPESAHLVDGRITRLRVTNLSYRSLQEPPLNVADISGSLSWQDSILTITDLKALSSYGQLKGTFSAGFKQPSLMSDLAIVLSQPVAEMDQFSLQTGQGHVKGSEQFAGTFKFAGTAGKRKLLELGGEVGMARNAINLRRLRLIRPGQKGLITADGSLAFRSLEPVLSLQVKATGLDLAPQLNVPTDLSGTLRFSGTPDSYQGDFTLANQAHGWQAATVSAKYQGTRETMRLAPLTGSILDGSLAGNLDMNWRDGFELRGMLSGSNLNPTRLDPGWKGVVNFSATGFLSKAGKAPLSGSVSGALLESRLHEQALTGLMQADFVDNNLSLNRLALQGKGFDLHASGDLKQRLIVATKISDFSRLVPGSSGTLQADGWVRWSDRQLSGAVAGTGSKLAYAGMRIAAANLHARLGQGTGYPLHVEASLRDVMYDGYLLNAVTLAADGTLPRHTMNVALRSAGSEARLSLAAGYNAGIWKGNVTTLAGRDNSGPWNLRAPAAFAVSAGKISLSPLAITAGAAESLEVAADLTLNPLSGQVSAQWAGLNLARANAYLKELKVSGNSRGTVRLGFLSGKRLALAGSAAGSGTFTGQGGSMTLQQGLLTCDGGEQGLRVGIELSTAGGGRLKGSFSSSDPLRLVVPEKGNLTAEVNGIDLALLKRWLPSDTRLEGRISGRTSGIMLPGQHFELDGNAVLSEGKLHQERPDGELNFTFESATASWGWRGEALAGTVSLTMADYGQARANFQLPVSAQFPVALNPKGPFQASFTGKLREKGIITALFPGFVQESSGEIDAGLAVSGTWEAPQIGGTLQLTKAGAYLPTAGIHLKDVQLAARLEKNLIRIDSYRAVSGTGHIEGTALLTLEGWRLIGYQGTIRGENFQTVHLPELQIQSTPKLSFEGTPKKLSLRGELLLPELHIVGAPARTTIAPSSDVILEGRVVPLAASSPLALDVQVRVVLGEKVFVKVAGIDAQLGGAMDLSFSSLDRINSAGEIKVVKGRYRTYGVNLEIVRGRLFFTGGSIDRPTLDFLALRTIGDVRAGVTVTGNLQKPVTKLYSEPAMPDVDVLAYIVLGHPIGSSGEQAGLVAQAAGAMLTSGQAEVLQDKIKNKFGLSTLEIQGGVGGTTSHMGYKPMQVTPPGAIPAVQQPGITETMLTVGKYLTPQLYVSYGRSVFTGGNLFLLRYDIFKHWQIETQTGSESGADLFYKLEFM
jgi:translocation and assembly module TamB